MMVDFKDIIADAIYSEELGLTKEEIKNMIEIPADEKMGDYAFPCFRLAKALRKAPQLIAADIAAKAGDAEAFAKVENVNAYVNFFIDRAFFAGEVIDEVGRLGADYGKSDGGAGRKVIVEYSSPNIAKPFHIGHIRSTVIGNALYKLYDAVGFDVVRINHLGDYGTQFGKMIVAYRKWGSEEELAKEPIKALLGYYTRFHEEAKEHPELEDEARETFVRLEAGEPAELELWEKFRTLSLEEFNRVYNMLGITFDSYAGESFYSDKMPRFIQELKDKGLLMESQGAQIVGKKVLQLMGYEWEKDCIHVPFGLVSLSDGDDIKMMSTREGRVVFLEDVLNTAVAKTAEIMRDKDAQGVDIDEVSKEVGIGAVIFQELSNNKIKDYVFSWDKVLNFDGETGPYVQYTHARASSVLRKAEDAGVNVENLGNIDTAYLSSDSAYTLAKLIYRVPEVVVEAAEKYEPSIVTRHLVDIAQSFNKFYHDEHILVEDESERNAKLALVKASKTVIANCLGLLGIAAPERM